LHGGIRSELKTLERKPVKQKLEDIIKGKKAQMVWTCLENIQHQNSMLGNTVGEVTRENQDDQGRTGWTSSNETSKIWT